MTIETVPFDAALYLDTQEDHVALISDALATGDASYIATALGVVARSRGMSQIAKEAGVTREALYKALSPEGDPKLTTLIGVMKALGIRLKATPADTENTGGTLTGA
ncbi:addiction module antidote protein [Parvibaculum sp.]|uniref:addiction module antidote protein n=1 Tax=Parvibaculum sp. TaxID=2024848 RepID=UPI0027189FC1|nr:addiction module antidote protein [Parvibaculum sp.]MDO9128157.1 putative addiction module antidote protein [Parvibaculum sp.]MDP1628284.1 putative addiction module antidote protein [Parvibaculum sp.]MDP2149997.1 putative addiction module antidote protein [Parvibaculum sp.]MDP3330288.1 putative addiction module antidote protein [Parvibaculum sp.]